MAGRSPQWRSAMEEAKGLLLPGRLAELEEDSTLAEVRAEVRAAQLEIAAESDAERRGWARLNREGRV